MGENPHDVTTRLKAKLEEIKRAQGVDYFAADSIVVGRVADCAA